MKKVFTILLVSMIAFSMGFGQNNYADVSGVVTDIKGNPLPDLTVFVPFTSIGTTTNIKGEYSLSRLIPGKIELVFRHVAYKALSKTILAESNESIKLDVSLEENTIELAEIVKRADPANWELGWEKFKTHVLGDQMGRYCKVSNPKDLYFYYDGERLTGHATKPLEIINNYLGYKLVYFLDYFWLQEGKLLPDDLAPKTTFAFSGSAFYVDRMENNRLRGIAWKRNRKTEFQGTLRHFLLSVFYDRLEEQGFIIKRSWKDAKDFQKTQEISPSVAFVQFHQMNKVFYWDPFLKKSMYLHYSLQEDYPLLSKVNDLMQVPPSKSLLMNDRLLVFHAWKSDFVKGDVRIAYFAIKKDDSGETPMLLIDDQGNYRIKSGELIWNYLDNQTNLLSALPEDYKWNNEK